MAVRHARIGIGYLGAVLVWGGITAAQAAEFDFGTTFAPPQGDALHAFALAQDSAVSLYSTLGNGATCGNSGYGIVDSSGADVVRSGFAACSATEPRGPWPLKAGSYQLKLWHNASGGTYAAKLLTQTSTRANDTEPNDTPATATAIPLQQASSGHLGYKNATGTDSIDQYSLTLSEEGALTLDLSTDASLSRGSGVSLSFPDGTTVRDASRLSAGRYLVSVYADTYYEGAYGGYTLTPQFTPAAAPPTPTTGGQVQSSNVGLNDRYVVLQSVFTPTTSDVRAGGNLNVYLAAHYQGQFYFFVRVDDYNFRLSLYTGGEPTPYTSVAATELSGKTWTLGLFDVSALVPPGFDLYAGFGRSLTDMLTRNQVKLAHQVK